MDPIRMLEAIILEFESTRLVYTRTGGRYWSYLVSLLFPLLPPDDPRREQFAGTIDDRLQRLAEERRPKFGDPDFIIGLND